MKRNIILAMLMILLIPANLFVLLSHVGLNHTETNPIVQAIYGYVDEIFILEISEPVYGGAGFNLDITDPSNSELSYQIAPTNQPLSQAGAVIGSFSITTSNTNKVLKITHTPLMLDSDTSVTVDWEMGIGWYEGTVHNFQNCLSIDDAQGEANRKVVISLAGEGAIRINDARIYFRLTYSSPLIEAGQYHASVVFEVENTT